MKKRAKKTTADNNRKPLPKRTLTPALTRLVVTWRLFWQQRRKLTALAAVVVVPSTFIRAASELTIDFSLVLFVAAVFTVLALMHFCHNIAVVSTQSVAKTYTQSSGRFLQLLGVTLLQALALLPAIFAGVLAIFVGGFNLSYWLYIPALLILILTALCLAGLSLAQFVAVCEQSSVLGSLQSSWRRTRRVRTKLVGHFALILLVITAMSTAIFFVVNISSSLVESWFVQAVVSSALLVIALPWFITYGYSVYAELSE